jgi:ribonucleotide reductase alpha subunit
MLISIQLLRLKTSNMKMRPIGVGVQGLADVFYMFSYPYGSDEARDLNKKIFETIYYGCLKESCELAKSLNLTIDLKEVLSQRDSSNFICGD